MSDFSAQSEEKPGTTNFQSKYNNYYVNAEAVHFGVGDNNPSKGIILCIKPWLFTHTLTHIIIVMFVFIDENLI